MDARGELSIRMLVNGAFSRRVAERTIWCTSLCLLAASVVCSQVPARQSDSAGHLTPRLETSEQTNDRIAELAQASLVKQGDYLIGSGDVLTLDVFDVKELSGDLRVDESGMISIPLVSKQVQAAGLTTFQLQAKLGDLLKEEGLVTDPHVSVSVKERHGAPVTVTGAVKIPTVIQTVRQMTLLEVLSQAGGVSPDAGSDVLVTRPSHADDPTFGGTDDQGTSSIKIDLNDLLYSGNLRFNIPIIGGDVVTVSHADVVYAVGALQHPGGFVMQSNREQMTVLKLVSLSGGWLPSAKPTEAFILRQDPDTGQRTHVPVDVKKILTLKTEDVTMRQNDILYVPDSTGKRALRRTGEIAISLATGAALYRVETGIP
jgi:polysaccharide export outer membrane protein